jgi:trimeric autotransporter adhesin
MKLFYRILFVLALSAIVVGVLPVFAQTTVTYTVNSANDVDDGACNATHCSLREAINANNQSDPGDYSDHSIIFSIAGAGLHTIQPTTPLATITRDVTIDATTQPGYALGAPVIELNGSNVVASDVEDKVGIHITLSVNYDSIRGFVINGFEYAGLMIEETRNYRVESNFIGTNATGTQAVPNGYGIILRNANSIDVGVGSSDKGNVISGNTFDGINIHDDGSFFQSGFNRIFGGNHIGVNADGTAALGNGGNGISVESSQGTRIGQVGTGIPHNVISGNLLNGIKLTGDENFYTNIQGNFIGTDVTGTNLLGNTLDGILVEGSAVAHIGEDIAIQAYNIIAGNKQNGIHILTTHSTLNAIYWNSIFDNVGLGIELGSDGITPNDAFDADNGPSTLQNYPVLTKAVASPTNGIAVQGTLSSKAGHSYVIDFFVSPSCDPSGYGQGKEYIGSQTVTADASGNAAFLWQGIRDVTPGHFITAIAAVKGLTPGNHSNNMSEFSACIQALDAVSNGFTFIVNNADDVNDGVCNAAHCSFREALSATSYFIGQQDIINFNLLGAHPHSISSNNYALSTVSGVIIDGTTQPGYAGKPMIYIHGSNANYCSLTVLSDFNVIRGLGMIADCKLTVNGNDNIIQGNYFGTDPGAWDGIWVQGGGLRVIGDRNIIGGTLPVERNIIGAPDNGFSIRGNNNLIQGNYVGVNITGTSVMPNGLSGISIDGNNNMIGGTTPGTGNIIAGAKYGGVRITQGYNNAILGNNIFANVQKGIDLNNYLFSFPNDPGDLDEGPNHLQNSPVLELAVKNETVFTIKGSLNSTADTAFRLEFFASRACDISGYGEGEIYLGFTNVLTAADANVSFEVGLPVDVPSGYAITATATDPDNNTSEFSACLTFLSADAAPTLNYYRTPFVEISWKDISWAARYLLQIDTDPDFQNDVYADSYFSWSFVYTTNLTLNLPNNDNVYYWRVGAINEYSTLLQWSTTQSFTVDIP